MLSVVHSIVIDAKRLHTPREALKGGCGEGGEGGGWRGRVSGVRGGEEKNVVRGHEPGR